MGIKLKEWYKYNSDEDKMKKLFFNMSSTMKYIHSYDYCVKSFNLNDIEILNSEKLSPIQYNTVVKIPVDDEGEVIHEDIYNLAFMQIGIYTNTLDNLKPQFLKDNFDSFATFLPEDDVPYYKGIIERGASVYYCDYVNERTRREVAKLQSDVGELSKNNGGRGIQKRKTTDIGVAYADRDTKNLYNNLDDSRQAAFTNFLILPIAMIMLGIVLSIMLFIS